MSILLVTAFLQHTFEKCWYHRLLTWDPARYWFLDTAFSLAQSGLEHTKVADNIVKSTYFGMN
jgi:hypothetical protein